MYMHAYVCIYIGRERERERDIYIYIYMCICIYIYIYTHRHAPVARGMDGVGVLIDADRVGKAVAVTG